MKFKNNKELEKEIEIDKIDNILDILNNKNENIDFIQIEDETNIIEKKIIRFQNIHTVRKRNARLKFHKMKEEEAKRKQEAVEEQARVEAAARKAARKAEAAKREAEATETARVAEEKAKRVAEEETKKLKELQELQEIQEIQEKVRLNTAKINRIEFIRSQTLDIKPNIYDILNKTEIDIILKPLFDIIDNQTTVEEIDKYSLDSKIKENQETIRETLINEATAKLKETKRLKIKSINEEVDAMELNLLSEIDRNNILKPLFNIIENQTTVEEINKYSLNSNIEENRETIKQKLNNQQTRPELAKEEEAKRKQEEEKRRLEKERLEQERLEQEEERQRKEEAEAAEAARKEAEKNRLELEESNEKIRQQAPARKKQEEEEERKQEVIKLNSKLLELSINLETLNTESIQTWNNMQSEIKINQLLKNKFFKIENILSKIKRIISSNFNDEDIEEAKNLVNKSIDVIEIVKNLNKLVVPELRKIIEVLNSQTSLNLNTMLKLDTNKIKHLLKLDTNKINLLLQLDKNKIKQLLQLDTNEIKQLLKQSKIKTELENAIKKTKSPKV